MAGITNVTWIICIRTKVKPYPAPHEPGAKLNVRNELLAAANDITNRKGEVVGQ